MSLLDIALARRNANRDGYSALKAGASRSTSRIEYGVAMSNSANGYVTIRMDNAATDGSADFTVPCESPISQGDRVSYISTKGKGKAVSVATLSQIAQDAEDIATATNQHFWADANGIHVSTDAEVATGTRNILINSLGILLRKAANTLVSISESAVAFFDGSGNQTASFGNTGAVVGSSSTAQTIITSDGLEVDDVSGDSIFEAKSSGALAIGRVYRDEILGSGNNYSARIATVDPVAIKQTYVIAWISGEGFIGDKVSLLYDYPQGADSAELTGEVLGSQVTFGIIQRYYTSPSDFGWMFSGYGASRFQDVEDPVLNISYCSYTQDAPYITIGTREGVAGAYSMTAGDGLIASAYAASAVGSFNIGDTPQDEDELPQGAVFVVGNGTDDNHRSNAFSVSWSGDIAASGDYYDQSGIVKGLPSGGTSGQVLAKASGTDYDVEWVNQSGGSQSVFYGTSSTAAATAAKVVVCSDFTTLSTGAIVFVKFTYGNTYNGTATLNVNSTGAKSIATVGTTTTSRYHWAAGEAVGFVYDGTNWLILNDGLASTTYYGATKLSSATNSTSTALAATPSAVKAAYDLAASKSVIGHTHGLSTATAEAVDVFSAGSLPTLGTAISVNGVDTFTPNTPTSVTLPTFDYETKQIPSIASKTVVTGGSTTSIPNVTSVGSTPTLGTAFTVPNVTSVGTAASASVANGVLTLTNGTAPTLGTAFTVPNVTSVGSTPTLGTAIDAYTSLTTGDSITVGTPTQVEIVSVLSEGSVTAGSAASLTTTNHTIPNVTGVGTLPTLTTETVTVLTSATTDASTD